MHISKCFNNSWMDPREKSAFNKENQKTDFNIGFGNESNQSNSDGPFIGKTNFYTFKQFGFKGSIHYDGHPAIPLTKPEYVTEWNRFECIGINEKGLPILEQSNNGKIWQEVDAQQQIATDEFWRVMKLLNKQLQ